MNYHHSMALIKPKVTLNKTRIISVGTHLPSQVVKSDDLFREIDSHSRYGTPINWMSEQMGVIERRVAPSDAKPSDLAISACRKALENADDVPFDEIDMVLFCGIERDQPEPATAHTIQKALGLNAGHTFDVANACFGFMNGLEIASQFIKAGTVRYALVCTGETPSKVMKAILKELKQGVDQKTYHRKIGALSVGDAGGAVIVGPSNDESGFELFNTQSFSRHKDKCIYNWNSDGSVSGQMNMGSLSALMINTHKSILDDTLEKLNWPNFDWLLIHQMGERPYQRLRDVCGIHESQMPKTFDRLGNLTSANFPVCYEKLLDDGLVKRGDRVGGLFAGSGIAIGQFGYTF